MRGDGRMTLPGHARVKERDVAKSAKNWIVETEWLADHLTAPDLVVFDAS